MDCRHPNDPMLKRLDRVASETLGALHRDVIGDHVEIRAILDRAARRASILSAGINRRNDARRATIIRIEDEHLLLSTANISPQIRRQLFFNLMLDGVHYFFACTTISRGAGEHQLRVTLPSSVYRADRRDLGRRSSSDRVFVIVGEGASGEPLSVEVRDTTLHGLSIRVPESVAMALPSEFQLRLETAAEDLFGRVRHRTPDPSRKGWAAVGLSVSSVPTRNLITVDRRERILDRRITIQDAINFASAGINKFIRHEGLERNQAATVELVKYKNEHGQTLCGIENRWGSLANSTAVIIPPAWGRTKETMLPLAMTLVETFRRAGEPIRVLRFDGTNRRGESYIDRVCRHPGDEYLHFTFSQAARDISATVSYLESDRSNHPRSIVLITFSLAAVEGRHALAMDKRISGWVSVVGMADLQAALRTISGGIDYGSGLLRGIRFGRHELVGVIADMDHTGLDAIRNGIGFLEDARRDMARIEIPITWIHGRYDAWMDLDRVIETMSCGRTDNRRIIEVPTGHQLRSGPKALATFQLIAEEVTEMALGARRRGFLPKLSRVSAIRSAERGRLSAPETNVKGFWADYLLGRSRVLGMELLAATAAYRNFMETQVKMLRLASGDRIADLGSGTGEFSLALWRGFGPKDLVVVELDFIREALSRARSRRQKSPSDGEQFKVGQCVADLDLGRGDRIPIASESFDAVLASLVISYVASPERFAREIFRILKPGGRLVVSSMVRDADAMMLFHDGLLEYVTDEARESLGGGVEGSFDSLVRDFLNDGSRLLDLEERGRFEFSDESELRYTVANAGFAELESRQGFGEPAQAVIVTARRP